MKSNNPKISVQNLIKINKTLIINSKTKKNIIKIPLKILFFLPSLHIFISRILTKNMVIFSEDLFTLKVGDNSTKDFKIKITF